jgi:hypothetical protein
MPWYKNTYIQTDQIWKYSEIDTDQLNIHECIDKQIKEQTDRWNENPPREIAKLYKDEQTKRKNTI